MRRRKRILALLPLFLIFGVTGLFRHSEKLMSASDSVRLVDIIGLATAGAMCGVFLVAVMWRDQTPVEQTKERNQEQSTAS